MLKKSSAVAADQEDAAPNGGMEFDPGHSPYRPGEKIFLFGRFRLFPARRLLLEDDTVVVYKIDRLTRSLTDFAKIIEIFGTHATSFVSVTQQFNTTTSMGRLTLNVLLSFAQFEREVTAERIRDKIAASKKKGMWMGGTVPLGYDVRERHLIVNESEAVTIRLLFKQYLRADSVRHLKTEIDRLGVVTKRRVRSDGSSYGGRLFSRGNLYALLSNPVYIGQVRHKRETYPGQHHAIIDAKLWQTVQDRLAANAALRRTKTNRRHPSLLAGLAFDDAGDRLSPSHAVKNGRRYRYYISHRLMQAPRDDRGGWRLPASQFEQAILIALGDLLADEVRLIRILGIDAPSPEQARQAHGVAAELRRTLEAGIVSEQRPILDLLVDRIIVQPDRLSINLNRTTFLARVVGPHPEDFDDSGPPNFSVPLSFRRRGVETKLVLGDRDRNAVPDAKLIETVARARDWLDRLIDGRATSINHLAEQTKVHPSEVSRLLPLAFLAPDIIEAIVKGRQPPELTAELLVRSSLPKNWERQRRALGFPPGR